MDDQLRARLDELRRMERDLRRQERELEAHHRRIKEQLLAGDTVEPGEFYAQLRLLPGRDPASKNPDDYELDLGYVS
ncbi:MAG TPA: hypothetical protein VIW23_01595 [Candidatus Acidoferrum sp.]